MYTLGFRVYGRGLYGDYTYNVFKRGLQLWMKWFRVDDGSIILIRTKMDEL